jgi:hypothetical protein
MDWLIADASFRILFTRPQKVGQGRFRIMAGGGDEMSSTKEEFEQAAEGEQLSLVQEFLIFLKENKKWWLLPILIVLALVGLLTLFAGTGFAPFIYPMM